ncbi:MAG: hypothetical protein AAGA48_18940 [Myxococcota bacterium]
MTSGFGALALEVHGALPGPRPRARTAFEPILGQSAVDEEEPLGFFVPRAVPPPERPSPVEPASQDAIAIEPQAEVPWDRPPPTPAPDASPRVQRPARAKVKPAVTAEEPRVETMGTPQASAPRPPEASVYRLAAVAIPRPVPRQVAEPQRPSMPDGQARTLASEVPLLHRQVALPAGDGFRDLHITIDKLVVQTAPKRLAPLPRPPRPPLGPAESLQDYLERRDGKDR